MKRICNQCLTEMIEGCKVTVEGDLNRIKISQKGKGFFNNISALAKASVCTSCGYVAFYVDEYKEFKK